MAAWKRQAVCHFGAAIISGPLGGLRDGRAVQVSAEAAP